MFGTLDRRKFLGAAIAASATPLTLSEARAQSAYPNKPIRLVVGYPAGGQTDIVARTYGEYITRVLGQPVIVENKAGGGGILAAVEVKRAPPDGYTLMATISTTMVNNRATVKDLPYGDADFTIVSMLSQIGNVMVVNPKLGVTNLNEFVAYARKNRVNFGNYALGSSAHMIIVELNKQYGLNIEAIHYRGEAPMWADVMGQTLDGAIGTYNGGHAAIQAGRGRPIGVTGLQRLTAALPDIPTLAEQGAKSRAYELLGFACFVAPAGVPTDIVKKIADTIVAGSRDAKVKATMDQYFLNPPLNHEESQTVYAQQVPLWVEFMQGLGIKPE